MYTSLLLDDAGPVARITLNRPDKRNPLGPSTIGELVHALRHLCDTAAVRVIVLTGAGPAFSAGGDLGQMAGQAGPEAKIPPASLVDLFTVMHGLGKPIVTQVAALDKFYPAEAYHQNYLALHPTQPYIVYNDLPKLEALKKEFPDWYRVPPK